MISRNSFNKMALLALSLIVLLGSISFGSIRSSAFDGDYKFYDSGYDSGYDESVGSSFTREDAVSIRDNLSAIRQGTDIFIYFIVPCFIAAFAICKFWLWFYRTFIQGVLG